jgi:preprotein translocase subunit SecG
MDTVLLVVHIFVALALIGLVLLQHGKGADMGAAFGSGASTTVFGARGSGSFMSRSTAVLATVFFLTSLTLAYFVERGAAPASVMEKVQTPTTPEEVLQPKQQEAPAAAKPEQQATEPPPPAKADVPNVPEEGAPSEQPAQK